MGPFRHTGWGAHAWAIFLREAFITKKKQKYFPPYLWCLIISIIFLGIYRSFISTGLLVNWPISSYRMFQRKWDKCFWLISIKHFYSCDMSFILPHSARTWILNPSCALMRARVGSKIRFDQPTHPTPGFVLLMVCGVPNLIVLEVCALSSP